MNGTLKRLLKIPFNILGFDVVRLNPPQAHRWLRDLNIRTVLDIGANDGRFARKIHAILPSAAILSFEPLRIPFLMMQHNMMRVANFRAFQFALGDDTTEAEIQCNEYTPSSSLLPMTDLHREAFPGTSVTRPERIQIKRLDDVVKDMEIGRAHV